MAIVSNSIPFLTAPPPLDARLSLTDQNDSLRHEFPGLMEDVEPFLEVAREAFGNEPDAVNLWIGDERSKSSVHKDHYEVCISMFGYADSTRAST